MTDRLTGPETTLRSILAGLVRRHRWRLVTTYGLTLAENGCVVLYPLSVGIAIDGLLAGRWASLVPLVTVWLVHIVIGLVRLVYDTRAFTVVHADLVLDTVDRQRGAGVAEGRIVARVMLARELVDFLQVEVPAMIGFVTLFVGAILMLFWYDPGVGLMALAALGPILVVTRWFARRSYRLNGALNDRLEREVEIVGARPMAQVRRHYGRVRAWRIRISNAQAGTWGVIELATLGLAVAALLRLTALDGVTAGMIYAVLAYVWDYCDAADDLPVIVENLARVQDIGERLAEG